jgi:hypothetical protein
MYAMMSIANILYINKKCFCDADEINVNFFFEYFFELMLEMFRILCAWHHDLQLMGHKMWIFTKWNN